MDHGEIDGPSPHQGLNHEVTWMFLTEAEAPADIAVLVTVTHKQRYQYRDGQKADLSVLITRKSSYSCSFLSHCDIQSRSAHHRMDKKLTLVSLTQVAPV